MAAGREEIVEHRRDVDRWLDHEAIDDETVSLPEWMLAGPQRNAAKEIRHQPFLDRRLGRLVVEIINRHLPHGIASVIHHSGELVVRDSARVHNPGADLRRQSIFIDQAKWRPEGSR